MLPCSLLGSEELQNRSEQNRTEPNRAYTFMYGYVSGVIMWLGTNIFTQTAKSYQEKMLSQRVYNVQSQAMGV